MNCYHIEGSRTIVLCDHIDNQTMQCKLQKKPKKTFKAMWKHCPLRKKVKSK